MHTTLMQKVCQKSTFQEVSFTKYFVMAEIKIVFAFLIIKNGEIPTAHCC